MSHRQCCLGGGPHGWGWCKRSRYCTPPPHSTLHGRLLRQLCSHEAQVLRLSKTPERTSAVIQNGVPFLKCQLRLWNPFHTYLALSKQLPLALGTDFHLNPIKGNTVSRVPEVRWRGARDVLAEGQQMRMRTFHSSSDAYPPCPSPARGCSTSEPGTSVHLLTCSQPALPLSSLSGLWGWKDTR